MLHVTAVRSPSGLNVNSAVLVAWNGLRNSSLIRTSSSGRLSTIVMRPSPTLLLPAHERAAPFPAGAPSNEFFAAGSSFAHGDQASQLWKSLTCANTAGAGAAMVARRSMRNSDGGIATIAASTPTPSTTAAATPRRTLISISARLPQGRAGRRARDRRELPASVGHERPQEPHHERRDRHRDPKRQAEGRGADHDDDEPGSGQRRQPGTDAQERGQDEAERPEDLDHGDESQEKSRQVDLLRHLLDRHDQLRDAGEYEHEREQRLDDPQRIGHDRSPRVIVNSGAAGMRCRRK